MRAAGVTVFLLVLCSVGRGQSPPAEPVPTIPALPGVSPELLRLVVEDQWDRGMDMFTGRVVKPPDQLDWSAISERDERRQSLVRSMLEDGAIRTPREHRFAALIFQHSSQPADLALAHVLAGTAAANGLRGARWLSAAALDRYLQSVGQPQVFGTQFRHDEALGWTMEPYDREAVPDSLRAEWCVVSLEEQGRLLGEIRAGRPMGPTNLPACGD